MIVVDRIEGEFAVLLVAGAKVDFPLAGLPAGLREGDRLDIRIVEAESREAEDRLKRLQSRSPQGRGNIDL